jgi:hypothetical protein
MHTLTTYYAMEMELLTYFYWRDFRERINAVVLKFDNIYAYRPNL